MKSTLPTKPSCLQTNDTNNKNQRDVEGAFHRLQAPIVLETDSSSDAS
jgi:hypothetical protein